MESGAIISDGCPACRMNHQPPPAGEIGIAYLLGAAHGTDLQFSVRLLTMLCKAHVAKYQILLKMNRP